MKERKFNMLKKEKRIFLVLALLMALGTAFFLDEKILVSGTFEIRLPVRKELSSSPTKIKDWFTQWPSSKGDDQKSKSPTLFIPPVVITVGPTAGRAEPTTRPGEPTATQQPTFPPTVVPTQKTKPPTAIPTRKPTGSLDDFARCLTQKGMKMYGTSGCGACNNQRAIFGNSFTYINFVDCGVSREVCSAKRLRAYPTWEDGSGKLYQGTQSLNNLSQISGCSL